MLQAANLQTTVPAAPQCTVVKNSFRPSFTVQKEPLLYGNLFNSEIDPGRIH
jgi:hypothetical protein